MLSGGGKKGKKRRKEEKEEKKGRKRREKGRKGEKKGRKRKGKEGKGEYEDSVGGCVGRFFFQSPEVCQKLGRQPEFLATGDLEKYNRLTKPPTPAPFSLQKMCRVNPYATRHHMPENTQYSLTCHF